MTPVDIAPFIAVLACIQAISTMTKQNRYIREFGQAGAVSASTCQTLPELGLHDTRCFRSLVRRGVIEESDQGRWFLDQQRAAAFRARRLSIALPSITLATVGVGLVWVLVR